MESLPDIGVLREIPVELIDRNPRQPRQRIDHDALVGLASSLQESGVIEPLIVRSRGGRFELVAGERRWRAAVMIGCLSVPAVVRDDLDDAAAHELAVIENMARDDLTPIEEARAVATLCDARGVTKAEVARRVGRSRVAISNLIRLLDLPDNAQALIDQGLLSAGHGRALLLCGDHEQRRALAQRAAAEGWSVRQLELASRGRPARQRKPAAHPDHAALARRVADRFSVGFGRDVLVEPDGHRGLKLTLHIADAADAEAVLRCLGASADSVDGVLVVE